MLSRKAFNPLAVLKPPVVLADKAPLPKAVFVEILPAPLPTVKELIAASPATSSFLAGLVVPIPTLPALVMRIRSVLAVLNSIA